MMKYRYIIMVLLHLSLLMPFSVNAQDSFKNEEAMIKKANELFQNEEYIKAFEYYQTLLSNHRDNTLYSYRFGVCLMFSDKRDKEKPIKYLEKASKEPEMDVRVFYFLGKAYHQNYRFTDAKEAYQEYKKRAKSKLVAKYDIDRRIQECDNGLALLSSIHLLYVVNKVEVKESTFYRTYDMKNSGGMVIMKPEALKTKYDKKHNLDRTAFYVPENRILYFSSYGVKNITGKDIYRAQQLANGEWSEPEKLGPSINTNYDESYPYVTPDGKTLYFSSKGHNSMGGYDIFTSQWEPETNSWSKPINIGYPVNNGMDNRTISFSESGKTAYISALRKEGKGDLDIYRVKFPINIIIQLHLPSNDPNNPLIKDAYVQLNNPILEQSFSFAANQNTGYYTIILNRQGSYTLMIEAEGYETYTEELDLRNSKDEDINYKFVKLISK